VRIGLNTLYLAPGRVGGVETYARGLVRGLARIDPRNEYVLFANRENAPTWGALPANFAVHECPVRAASKVHRTLYEQLRLNAAARRLGIDLLHSLCHVAPPRRNGMRAVVTIPDIIFLRFPGEFRFVQHHVAHRLMRRAVREADRVLVYSEHTKGDLRQEFGVPANRVDVAPLAPGEPARDPEAARPVLEALRIPEHYIYSVLATYHHKNLDGLLRAFARLRERESVPHALVISGLRMAAHSRFEALVEELQLREDVIFTGWVPEAALRALYEGAACFVYPSLYEGFGLPVLEAMALGVPVVCSNATSLPEVAGDAALLVDPRDPAALAEALARCLKDDATRRMLVEKGRAHAARFTWEECARGTLASYQRAMAGGAAQP